MHACAHAYRVRYEKAHLAWATSTGGGVASDGGSGRGSAPKDAHRRAATAGSKRSISNGPATLDAVSSLMLPHFSSRALMRTFRPLALLLACVATALHQMKTCFCSFVIMHGSSVRCSVFGVFACAHAPLLMCHSVF